MRLRLGVLALVGVLLLAVGSTVMWVRADRVGSVPELTAVGEPVVIEDLDGGAVWSREGLYLDFENGSRLGQGVDGVPLLTGQVPTVPQNPDPVRILVVGDSFVYGHGVSDPDMRWWVRLEDALNARTSPGTFEVVAVGRNGASLSDEARWITSQFIADSDVDAVVLGLVFNDVLLSAEEMETGAACGYAAKPCPPWSVADTMEYRRCVDVPEFDPEAADRAVAEFPVLRQAMSPAGCDTAKLAEVLGLKTPEQVFEDPAQPPFGDAFRGAARSIVAAASPVPVFVLATPTNPQEAGWLANALPLVTGEGVVSLASPRTAEVMNALARNPDGLSDVAVHPADRHPGPRLTAMYAEDAADALLAALPAARVSAAQQSASPAARPVVASWMPHATEVTPTDRGATFDFAGSGPSSWPERYAESLNLLPQWVPCATLGRPHVRVMLDRFLPSGSRVLLRYTDGEAASVDVYVTGYEGQFRELSRTVKVGQLAKGEDVIVPVGGNVTGVLLAPADRVGCSTEGGVTTGPLEWSVELL